MKYSFKRGSSFQTRFLWLICQIIILKNAVAVIAGSTDSNPTFRVNFSIPHSCTHGSELKNPHNGTIVKFTRTSHQLHKNFEQEGCTDLSASTGCYISGNVNESGTYQLYPGYEEEKFQICSRLFHVPAATTTNQASTTSLTTVAPTTTVTQTRRKTLHLPSTPRTQTRRPTEHLTSTRTQTKASTLSAQPYEVVVTDQPAATGKKTMPLYVYIVIGVLSLLVVCAIGIIVLMSRKNKYKPTTGNEEHGGIPHPAENLDYMERESTGTYAEIEPQQPEYDYVGQASVNSLHDVIDSHCATSDSNMYLTPIGAKHNYHLEEYDMLEHVESDNYEKLQQSGRVKPYNLYETTQETSYITPTGTMSHTGRAASNAEGGHSDMAISSGDAYEDDYLKPHSSIKKM